MSTGESWHELMYDAGRRKSTTFYCVDESEITYEQIAKKEILGCGKDIAAKIFFISFMVMVSFIFLNLFIAIIIEGYERSQEEENM
jgi:hypothetical protein